MAERFCGNVEVNKCCVVAYDDIKDVPRTTPSEYLKELYEVFIQKIDTDDAYL